jgi:hypothetical protein
MFKKLIPFIAFALIAGPVFAADPAPATSSTSGSSHHKKHHSSSSKSHKSTTAPAATPAPAPK